MTDLRRREFLRLATRSAWAAATLAAFPTCIRKALALPASRVTGTIEDVQHVVILMMENRSFDHYFGTLRGVRGFGDRHPLPLPNGKTVWHQSDGVNEISPFRLNSSATSALRVASTPHTFADAQAAWGQGQLAFWPKFKTPISMGHYHREDIPFQFALADAFTICDAYHCSVTTGTDPNRIVFFSGSNFDPELRGRGENCTSNDAEVNNLRCWIKGTLPAPGYTYQGSPFTWQTLPELLEKARISWRIYQDPNDNWAGLMHGGLAFAAFRNSQPGSAFYDKGMSYYPVQRLAEDVKRGELPQVSWILPSMAWSEHPAPSSPPQGAEFTSRVLDALTADPAVWSRTAVFLGFDENDGLFDHVPPPAPPSYNPDGTLAGKATLDLRGQYFSDPERKYLNPSDLVSGTVRPWGLGPRVPFYVISPWSRGGWVNSQVFDHTSVGRFLEKRFGITLPAISPWHRAVCGDLTTAFNFTNPNDETFPRLPYAGNSAAIIATALQRPKPAPPDTPEQLFQEPGMRLSRALPYELHVHARSEPGAQKLALEFQNTGQIGAVFHVYDRLNLDRVPRRYTVEAGTTLSDQEPLWIKNGRYNLWLCGPNGFVREFQGELQLPHSGLTEIELKYDPTDLSLEIRAVNDGPSVCVLNIRANAYRTDGPWIMRVKRGTPVTLRWSLLTSHGWYDFTVNNEQFERRFAGRLENGKPSFSDPAL